MYHCWRWQASLNRIGPAKLTVDDRGCAKGAGFGFS
jgi:hypothetical protein